MAGSDSRRLFLALWPEAAVRDALVQWQRQVPASGGRPIPAENLHLTLLFLGPTPAVRQQCLEEAMSAATAAPFELRLDRLAYWRRPQVLWVGSEDTPPPLVELISTLQAGAVRCGCPAETRPFQVHLTLFRKLRKAPRPLPAVAPVVWPVDAVVLAESVTDPAGAQYHIVRRWPLGGSTSS